MKIKLYLLAFVFFSVTVQCQSILHPWHVVDNGGGKSNAGGVLLQGSIGQSAVQAMSASGINLEGGYIPGIRFLTGASSTMDLSVANGWNMVSVPLIVNDFRKSVVYPTAISSAFSYQSSYVVRDTLQNGIGYWVKFSSSSFTHAAGTSIARETINVADKWNMIGVPSYPLLISEITPLSPSVIASNYFGYSGGYYAEDTLKPGNAYWIKVNNAGKLVLKTGSVHIVPTASPSGQVKVSKKVPASLASALQETNSLTLTDAKGREQLLYFTAAREGLDPDKYELPPLPPDGIFDARYATNRMMETSDKAAMKEVLLKISSAEFPMEVKWDVRDGSSATLVVDGKETTVKGSGETRVASLSSLMKLRLAPSSVRELPKVFALHQNYPNPFNPTTTIRYDLPKEARVTIKIYDALGREVKTLVDDLEDAGFRSVQWNSTNNAGNTISSGLYFYRIAAAVSGEPKSSFTQVMKMLVVK